MPGFFIIGLLLRRSAVSPSAGCVLAARWFGKIAVFFADAKRIAKL